MDHPKAPILSIYINTDTESVFQKACGQWLTDPTAQFHQVVTVNPEFIMESRCNARFAAILNSASWALADGFGILCASILLFGRNRFARITGVHATLLLCELAAQLGKSVYLVGAREGIAAQTASVLQKRFPNLKIVGAEIGIPLAGTRTPTEYTDELVMRINAARPDIVLVAFGAPKQELWIADHLRRCPSVRIPLGVGGTFDYLSGAVPYAQTWIRAIGFEWLYRLILEPKRGKRIFTAVVRFPCVVFWSKISSLWRPS